MKSTGILVATAMIQAYQKGLKTETRRVKGLEEINKEPDKWTYQGYEDGLYVFGNPSEFVPYLFIPCPYGDAGDELVFREAWATEQCYDKYAPNMINALAASTTFSPVPNLWFLADGIKPPWCGKTRPALHLLNDLARFKPLLIARPVPQRLHSMTEADAMAEGAPAGYIEAFPTIFHKGQSEYKETPRDYLTGFARLWDSLYAKRGYPWSMNPWCWRLSFERYEGIFGLRRISHTFRGGTG